MRSLLLILALIFPLFTSAATVSGEASLITKPAVTQKTPATKISYYTGAKGGCYTLVKNKKTGKTTKKYVDKKFCKK